MQVNLLNILYGCMFAGMVLYMVKDVRDQWKYDPTRCTPMRRFFRCAALALFYLLPFLLALVVPRGYGLHAFIAGILLSILPIYYIMKPLWAVRPSESLLRKRYGIKSRRKPPMPLSDSGEKEG